MDNIRKVCWNELYNLVEKLSEKVKDKGYEYVYGIPRGGLVPAVILSHMLDIPMFTHFEKDVVNCNFNKNVLIIDDIADSGNTLKKLHSSCDVAVIFLKCDCNYIPKYYAEKTTSWIQFPYELDIIDSVSSVNFGDR